MGAHVVTLLLIGCGCYAGKNAHRLVVVSSISVVYLVNWSIRPCFSLVEHRFDSHRWQFAISLFCVAEKPQTLYSTFNPTLVKRQFVPVRCDVQSHETKTCARTTIYTPPHPPLTVTLIQRVSKRLDRHYNLSFSWFLSDRWLSGWHELFNREYP